LFRTRRRIVRTKKNRATPFSSFLKKTLCKPKKPSKKSRNCRFVILSNGNLHYFWDLERGSPYIITTFPTPDSVLGCKKITPDPENLIEEPVNHDYIVLTQRPNYSTAAAWVNETERPGLHSGQQSSLLAALPDESGSRHSESD
jgi:hypothetical protein